MKIIKTARAFYDWRATRNVSVGFTPTMGALHGGHLSLIKKSICLCDLSVVSIFVNPAQFAPHEDLDAYPKTLAFDIKNLEKLNVDVLFLPDDQEMYTNVNDVHIPPSNLFEKLEGSSRPHFFNGVTKIVSKLFNVIQPTHTFFGEKDAQQLIIIKEMINNMSYDINLVSCPTVRDQNGLALSSRNAYLSIEEQTEASNFSVCLIHLKDSIYKGELDASILKCQFEKELSLFPKFTLDYISIACKKTLNEIKGNLNREILVSAAVFYDDVRLIDNFSYLSST